MPDVELRREDGVSTVVLSRPEKHNLLTRALLDELRVVLATAANEGDSRVLVLEAAGRTFCAGHDPDELESGDVGTGLEESYAPVIRALTSLPSPTIAAVHGPCIGAGLALVAACDVRIAGERAAFVPGYIGLALTPNGGLTYSLERLVGSARAFEWLTTNRWLSAPEALSWGFVTEVVPADAFAQRVRAIADAYAAAPTSAVVATRRLLAAAHSSTLDEQLVRESAAQAHSVASSDFAEALAARRAGRKPHFKGS